MNKWIVLGFAAVSLAGCGETISIGGGDQIVGSGKVSSVSRKIGTFKSVDLDGAIDIAVKIGPQSEIKIEGDDNLLSHVRTVIKDNALHVDTDAGYTTQHPIKVSFSMPELNAATLNGSGDFEIHGCNAKDLSLQIEGSGNLKADGSAAKLVASITGSGDLQLSDLRAGDAKVDIVGSGDARVNVSGNLEASISGSGGIKYLGHPKKVDKSASGSGDISSGE